VAELADALDSKSSDRKIVWVRAPPPASPLKCFFMREDPVSSVKIRMRNDAHGNTEKRTLFVNHSSTDGNASSYWLSATRRDAFSPAEWPVMITSVSNQISRRWLQTGCALVSAASTAATAFKDNGAVPWFLPRRVYCFGRLCAWPLMLHRSWRPFRGDICCTTVACRAEAFRRRLERWLHYFGALCEDWRRKLSLSFFLLVTIDREKLSFIGAVTYVAGPGIDHILHSDQDSSRDEFRMRFFRPQR